MAEQTTPEQSSEQMKAERDALISQMRELDGEEPLSAPEPKADPQAGSQPPATSESDAGKGEGVKPLEEGQPPAEAGADKEAERKEKTWQQINAEKAALKAEREAISAEKAEAERLKQEAAEKNARAGQYQAEDYEAAAKRFEAEGDTDSAEQAREMARKLRVEVETQKQNAARDKFRSEWQDAVRQAKEDKPELADPENPLTKTLAEVFKNRPVFTSYPGGVADAVRIAELKLNSERVDSIQAERDKLQAQVDELQKKLQPGGATASVGETSAKEFKDLSLSEQGAILRKAAKQADTGGGADAFFG